MKNLIIIFIAIYSLNSFSEEMKWVTPAEPLFTSTDPMLHKNKQVVYHIVKDLLEANHWELAKDYISEKEYIQHNPNAKSGLDAVVYFFTKVRKVTPTPIPEKITNSKIIAVLAEKDLVTVLFAREVTPKDPKQSKYYTTWFDTFRIKDGKAVEHWDPATIAE